MFNEYAYVAGIIDGEGCFRINKTKRKNQNRYKYACTLTINMLDIYPLELMSKLFPTKIRKTPIIYSVRYNHRQTIEIINKLSNHLIIKKNEADLLLQLDKIKRNYNFSLPQRMHDIYEPLYQQCRDLKANKSEFMDFQIQYAQNQSPEPNLSYIGGLIDAEGCFGIYPVNDPIYTRFVFTNTNLDSVKLFSQLFNARIYKKRCCKPTIINTFPFRFTAELSNEEGMLPLINRIEPHLRIKNKQAALCRKFYENKHNKEMKRAISNECHLLKDIGKNDFFSPH